MKNAKIQFTVKFDNIPKEVLTRLKEANSILDIVSQTSEDVVSFTEENNFFEAINRIEDVRENLNYIDMIFGDCYNILTGYASHKAKLLEGSQNQEPQEQNQEVQDK